MHMLLYEAWLVKQVRLAVHGGGSVGIEARQANCG